MKICSGIRKGDSSSLIGANTLRGPRANMSAWSETGSFSVDGAFKRNACLAAMRLQVSYFGVGKYFSGKISGDNISRGDVSGREA